jgi:hypothetical protein
MKRSSIARSKQNWPCFSRRARRDSNGVANLTNARRSTTGGTDILLGFLGKVSFGLQNKRIFYQETEESRNVQQNALKLMNAPLRA